MDGGGGGGVLPTKVISMDERGMFRHVKLVVFVCLKKKGEESCPKSNNSPASEFSQCCCTFLRRGGEQVVFLC